MAFALIDEIDSILIDEASTPLVISRRSENEHPAPEPFSVAREMIAELQPDDHFSIAHDRPVLTEEGLALIESQQDRIPWSQLRRPWKKYVDNALHAQHGLRRDTDYMIDDKSDDEPAKVVIIDQFTGRGRPDSSWRDGLHQAVEACERLSISAESISDASISRQRFYRLYDAVGGMTGTAGSAAGEFWQAFRLPVRNVAPRKPSCAEHFPPRVFSYPRTENCCGCRSD